MADHNTKRDIDDFDNSHQQVSASNASPNSPTAPAARSIGSENVITPR